MARSEPPGFHDGDGQAGAVLLPRVLGHDLGRHPIMTHQLSLQMITTSSLTLPIGSRCCAEQKQKEMPC